MRRLILSFVLTLLTLGAVAQEAASFRVSERQTLNVDSVERVYSTYAPDTLENAAPLIIALHGRFSSGKAFEALSHLSEHADANGWIIAYPQAYEYSWEDGGRERGLPRVGDHPQDDVAFIDALISELREAYDISRVALVGFDTGGSMVERLLCESRHPVDAAMLVGAVAWSYNADQCDGKTISADMLLVYGARDTVYTGQGVDLTEFPQADGSLIRRMGFYESAQFWAAQAGCDRETPAQAGITTVFAGCPAGVTIAAMLLSDVGHEWPRAGGYLETGGVADAHDGGHLLAALLDSELPAADVAAQQPPRLPRTFVAYVPTTYTGESPMPVVVALHGRPDTGAGLAAISDFTPVAEDEDFIVVFPDGIGNQWSYLGGILDGAQFNMPDDVAFLSTLLDDLALDLNIDFTRAYLAGFSNGGFMTYRMACNPEPNRYAAYGIAGALLYPEMERLCLGAPPRPVLVEHGTEDISISWEGITHMPAQGMIAVTRSVLQSVGFFVARNGCPSDEAERTDIPPSDTETSVIRFDFIDCASGYPVRFFAVMNGGHGWPGVDHLRREIAGSVNMDINLSQELWAFFKDKRLEE